MSDRPRLKLSEVVRGLAAANESVRTLLAGRLSAFGRTDPPGRNVNAECGYPVRPTVQDYKDFYDREGVANRVVGVFPEECWSVHPELYEAEGGADTPFERAWNELLEAQNVWHVLHRADELSGIGHYGIVLIGLDDGLKLEQPVAGVDASTGQSLDDRPRRVTFLRTFDQTACRADKLETSVLSPRFGLPVTYTVRFADPDAYEQEVASAYTEHRVHWTRVLHVADNRKGSEAFGVPRMQPVFNRLFDLRKILSANGEAYWKSGFPGLALEAPPDPTGLSDVEIDEASIKEQLGDFFSGLQRYIALTNLTVKPLVPALADPSPHVEQHLRVIAMTLGVPYRVLAGSEVGQLASVQDATTWNRRVFRRQTLYLDPMLVRPFVTKLVVLNALPKPKSRLKLAWTDLNSMSDKDRADVALKKAQAMLAYATGGLDRLMPPVWFWTDVFGLSLERAEAVAAAASKQSDSDLLDPIGGPAGTRKPANPGTGPSPGLSA